MKSALLSLLIISLFINQNIHAQAGKPDKTFGVNGVAKIAVVQLHSGTSLTAKKIVLLKDGKFLVEVASGDGDVNYDVLLYRITGDGKIDSSFARNGRKIIHSGNDRFYLYDFTVDSGNNILLSTSRENYPDGFKLIRLLPNGVNDSSFGKHGYITVDLPNIYGYGAFSLQPNGKILIPGIVYPTLTKPASTYLFRFTKNGDTDSSFNKKGYVFFKNILYDEYPHGDLYYTSLTKPDSKILCVGTAITELKSDGKTIKNFGDSGKIYGDSTVFDGGFFKETFSDVNLLENGGFVCIGNFYVYNKYIDGSETGKVYKFKSDGTPDSSFALNGEETINYTNFYSDFNYPPPSVAGLRVQPDGKFILSNGYNRIDNLYLYQGYNLISRYLPNGAIDSSFGKNGSIDKKGQAVAGLFLQKDFKIVTLDNYLPGSNADTSFFYLHRYKNDVDTSSFVANSSNKENIQSKPSITISPNPVTNVLNIKGITGNTHLSIINAEGKVVATANTSLNNYSWNIQSLHAGNYFLVVEKENAKVASVQFIKQ